MKRKVTVTLELDPTEYEGVEDSAAGAIDLVIAMLHADADLPEQGVIVECENSHRWAESYDSDGPFPGSGR